MGINQGDIESHVKECKAIINLDCKEFEFTCDYSISGCYSEIKQ